METLFKLKKMLMLDLINYIVVFNSQLSTN
nr:MAG TPA: hypothetical protein [Caudoviricetes sp.]